MRLEYVKAKYTEIKTRHKRAKAMSAELEKKIELLDQQLQAIEDVLAEPPESE